VEEWNGGLWELAMSDGLRVGDDAHGTKGNVGESHGVHFWARWNGVGTLETSSTRGIVNILLRKSFLPSQLLTMCYEAKYIHHTRFSA
jgi:hypothetical protein